MNRYKSYMQRVPENRAVEYNALEIPKKGRERGARIWGMPRLAAAAAAFVLLLGSGLAVWALTGGGLPFAAENPVNHPGTPGVSERPGVLETVFAPFAEYEAIEYCDFWGPLNLDLVNEQPRILESQEEIRAFMEDYALQFGQGPDDDASAAWTADAVDFNRKTVIATIFDGANMTGYLAPLLCFADDTLTIMPRRIDFVNVVKTDVNLRGYFLLVDRDMVEGKNLKRAWPTDLFDRQDSSLFMDDITTERLREMDISVYKTKNLEEQGFFYKTDSVIWSYETYLKAPNSTAGGMMVQIGTGFGGGGVYDMLVTEGGKYLVYLYSWGSGMDRSQFGVLSLETYLPVYTSGALWNGTLEMTPSGSADTWVARNRATGNELAYVTIEDGSVQFEIVSEEGYWLAGLENPQSVPVETLEPGVTAEAGEGYSSIVGDEPVPWAVNQAVIEYVKERFSLWCDLGSAFTQVNGKSAESASYDGYRIDKVSFEDAFTETDGIPSTEWEHIEVYEVDYSVHTTTPEKVVLAGSVDMDNEGWVNDAWPEYLVFGSINGELNYLFPITRIDEPLIDRLMRELDERFALTDAEADGEPLPTPEPDIALPEIGSIWDGIVGIVPDAVYNTAFDYMLKEYNRLNQGMEGVLEEGQFDNWRMEKLSLECSLAEIDGKPLEKWDSVETYSFDYSFHTKSRDVSLGRGMFTDQDNWAASHRPGTMHLVFGTLNGEYELISTLHGSLGLNYATVKGIIRQALEPTDP